MANGVFHQYLKQLMGEDGQPAMPVDLDSDTIVSRIVSEADWTIDFTVTDGTLITKYNAEADQTLGSISFAGTDPRQYNAADSVFPTVDQDAAKTIDLIVILKIVTPGTAEYPLWLYDLASPVTPNGTNVTVQWNANGLMRLAGP